MANSQPVVIASNQSPVSVSGAVNIANLPVTQNVSGSVIAQLTSSNASVITVGSPVANQSVSGEVSVSNFPANQSVSGSVNIVGNPSISGTVDVAQTGAWRVSVVSATPSSMLVGASIIGLTPVNVTNFPTTQNISGSVAAWLQSTNASVITVGTAAANQSVSGTVQSEQIGTARVSVISSTPSSMLVGASIFGTVPVTQATAEWTVKSSIAGGIFPVSGSVAATITNTNVNVSGSVVAFRGAGGTWVTSLVSTIPSSVIVGTSIFGQLPAGTAPLGSVATLQGTNPWVVTNVGSVIAVNQGSVAATIINIPQASVHGTVKIFPASAVSGHGSVNGVASVQVLAAPGTGLHNYVTDFIISNTGAATTLVTFTDGDGSVIGKTIAPAGGGSNGPGLAIPMKTMQTNKVVNIAAATATSVLHAWLGGYKAP